MEPATLVYIGAASAIGGLLGTFATMHVAKKQIHAQVVSAERMKWIGLLRDSMAEFHGVLFAMSNRIQSYHESLVTDADVARMDRNVAKMDSETVLYAKICLMLNPNEIDHLAYVDLMNDAMKEASNNFTGDPEVLGRLLDSAQKILKREWERVKKGE